jgi:hypothetical protein
MRCIFCKGDSSLSKSVEHIIPESLGNKDHVLRKGIVCDKCNNYFARKVEKEVLEMYYFRSLRGRNQIESKKGKMPSIPGFMGDENKFEVEVFSNKSNFHEIVILDKRVFNSKKDFNKLYIPVLAHPPKDNLNISRFIGKVALEALALKVSNVHNWQEELIKNEALDELRNYVRYGNSRKIWPYYTRIIYQENQISFDKESHETYEILHEFDFLIPDKPAINGELYAIEDFYFVMAVMGVEYTINLTNGGLTRYFTWLADNQNKSILQMEKSEFHSNLKS